MKGKLLSILFSTIISTLLIGCGSIDTSTMVDENGVLIQEISEKEVYDEFTDTKDPTKIKIRNSYMVSSDRGIHLVLDIKAASNFEDNTMIRIIGTNEYGKEEELINRSTDYYTTQPDSLNVLNVPFKHGENDKFLVIHLGYDEDIPFGAYEYMPCESYKIELYTDYTDVNTPTLHNEYILHSDTIEEFSQEDFKEYMTDEMFNSTKTTNVVTFDGIQLEFVALDFNDEHYEATFNAKNTNRNTIEEQRWTVKFIPRNNVGVYNYGISRSVEIPELSSGETVEQIGCIADNPGYFDESTKESGNELLIQVRRENVEKVEEIKYLKIQY